MCPARDFSKVRRAVLRMRQHLNVSFSLKCSAVEKATLSGGQCCLKKSKLDVDDMRFNNWYFPTSDDTLPTRLLISCHKHIYTFVLESRRACFGSTYTKIGTIQRRLAWPLRKDDTQIREAFQIFLQKSALQLCFGPSNLRLTPAQALSSLLAFCGLLVLYFWGWGENCLRGRRVERLSKILLKFPRSGFGGNSMSVGHPVTHNAAGA